MSRLDCEIIRDLIPLCVEDIASDKSMEAVKEHIKSCEVCNRIYEGSNEPDIKAQNIKSAEPLNNFKKKYRKHTISLVLWSVFITTAIGILLWGKFGLQPGDEMGYALLTFYILMPLMSYACSIGIGFQNSIIKWFTPLLFGVLGGLIPYLVFSSTDRIFVFFAFIPSVVGLITGVIIKAIANKIK